MCAPTKDLVKIAAIAAVAYASGGSSLFASTAAAGTTTASTASLATTSLAIPTTVAGQTAATGFNFAGMFSTLGNVAKIATPIIGAAGSIYQGILTSNALAAKANIVNFEQGISAEAFQLRKIRRQREAAQAIGKQRALFGLTGVGIEGTPTDVLEQTSARFAEDQYYDLFNTSGKMYSQQLTAENLRLEAESARTGGYIKAATTLAMRGDSFSGPIQGLFGTTSKTTDPFGPSRIPGTPTDLS
jgi:hypothetical protein